MNYVGIDLHSNNNFTVIANPEGRRLFERRIPNDLKVILARLDEHAPIASVAVEITYNYYWLTDGLLDAGTEFFLPILWPWNPTRDSNTRTTSTMRAG
jgi:hypothetical protein